MPKKKNPGITWKNFLWACVVAIVAFVLTYATIQLYLPSPGQLVNCPAIYPTPEWCYERFELFQNIKLYASLMFGGIASITIFLFMIFRKFKAVKWLSLFVLVLFVIAIIRHYIM